MKFKFMHRLALNLPCNTAFFIAASGLASCGAAQPDGSANVMSEQDSQEYYSSRKSEILAIFDTHAKACSPFLVTRYGDKLADTALRQAREQLEALIPEIPYIGGDENPMTRHLVRSTTSLVLYRGMRSQGKLAEEVGQVIYDAVVASVSQLPPRSLELTAEYIAKEKEQARKSQERRYPGDWVWEFVEGDGEAFDYGYDFLECGAQKLYHAHSVDEFLPFYCYLDFVTHRTMGWGFARSMTLAEGHKKCDFRWKKGGETKKGWPPPFLKQKRNQRAAQPALAPDGLLAAPGSRRRSAPLDSVGGRAR